MIIPKLTPHRLRDISASCILNFINICPYTSYCMQQTNESTPTRKARILVFTGDGKGKTTAAMGMALRAAGHGIPTRILQFLKANEQTGELAAFAAFPHVHMHQVGKGFVPKPDHPGYACHRSAAEHGFAMATDAVLSGKYTVIILDEICTAISLGLLPEALVIKLLQEAPDNMIIALTGRGATAGILLQADTVSEITCIKHGMDTGHGAQKGCEL